MLKPTGSQAELIAPRAKPVPAMEYAPVILMQAELFMVKAEGSSQTLLIGKPVLEKLGGLK